MGEYVAPLQPAESYNGAAHENFTWSQSISDLDVIINIPNSLTSPRDLKVHVSAKEIRVEVRKNLVDANSTDWQTIFQGNLSFRIKKHEAFWNLTPGRHVNIYLEKQVERWWEALIIGETKIQLDKIDCSKDMEELDGVEQMKLQELMWKHQQKLSTKPSE